MIKLNNKIFFIAIFCCICCYSQNTEKPALDSLLQDVYDIRFSVVSGDMELESFSPVFKLLKVYDTIKDPKLQAKTNRALGYFYSSTFEFDTAISYYEKALENYEQSEQWRSYADVSKQLAMLHCDLRQFDRAEAILLKSLEIAQQHDLGFYVLKPLHEIAIFYSYHKNVPEKGIEFGKLFQENLEHFKRQGIESKDFYYTKTIDAAIVDLEMGNSYLKLDLYDKAKEHLDKSLRFFLPTEDQEKLTRIYKHLFTWALETEQDNKLVIGYLEQFYHYNTEYYRDYVTSVRGRVNNIQQINNYKEKLEIERENLAKERALRKNITILLVVLIILLFVIIIILKQLYKTQKKYNRKLVEEKEVLLSIDKERKLYFSIISHELRTPMFTISGLIDVLKRSESLKISDEIITPLETSTNYLKHLIENILVFDATKGNGDTIKVKIEDFELKQFVSFVKNKFYYLADKKAIDLVVAFQGFQEETFVRGFKDALDQILSNLIINAIKFSEENQKIFINVDNLSKQNLNKLTVRFSVKDTGEGMDDELKSKLFNFQKQITDDEVNTSRMEGIGIGLSVTYNLLTQFLDSNLIIDSHKGAGSTFSFIIEFDRPKTIEQESKSRILENKLKILVIDDNRIALMVTKKLLETKNMQCYTCTDSDDVLAIIKEKGINAVIVDINMPVMNGYQMSKLIKENFKIPVIAHTAGNGISKTDAKVMEAKIDDVLIKPYTLKDFTDKLTDLL